jgi:hypothetical protein
MAVAPASLSSRWRWLLALSSSSQAAPTREAAIRHYYWVVCERTWVAIRGPGSHWRRLLRGQSRGSVDRTKDLGRQQATELEPCVSAIWRCEPSALSSSSSGRFGGVASQPSARR